MKPNLFNSIKLTRPQKNKFDLTHDVKMSGKMGELYPIMAMECVPGDSFHIGCDSLIRFAPILAPVMHRVDVTMHYFFVPNRLVWENWEDFITANVDTPPVMPYFPINNSTSAPIKRFLDYFGIPPITAAAPGTYNINALPLAAYQMIYNEYYRDQNLINPVSFELVDGNNSGNLDLIVLRNRAYEHDYFTASLPFAQKGAAVSLPLGQVELDPGWNGPANPRFVDSAMNPSGGATVALLNGGPLGPWIKDNTTADIAYDPNGSLVVGDTTINDLRRAFKLQEWLERNAVGGTRYIEHIYSHFGVKSSDKRLQRPEYITGVKSPVVISEVLNTTGVTQFFDQDSGEVTDTGAPQGTMAGHGVAVTSGKLGKYFCEEHGYIIGVLSVMPKTAYQQGIPKHFLKNDYLDYYFPSFAHLGEQAVVQSEIFADTATPNATFGYVPRYAEYKYLPSRVAGDFRTTLNYWHLGRIFATDPTLSQDFIECVPDDVKRIFAVQDGSDNLWMHVLNKVTAIRPMPVFGQPSI